MRVARAVTDEESSALTRAVALSWKAASTAGTSRVSVRTCPSGGEAELPDAATRVTPSVAVTTNERTSA